MLGVMRAEEFRGGIEVFLIDRRLVELQHDLFVRFHLCGIGGVSGRRQRDHGGGEDEAKHSVLLFCWLGNPLVPATRLGSLREQREGGRRGPSHFPRHFAKPFWIPALYPPSQERAEYVRNNPEGPSTYATAARAPKSGMRSGSPAGSDR